MEYTPTTEEQGEACSLSDTKKGQQQRVPRWYLLGLALVLLLSLFLNFYRLGQDGYGNLYYAAGVKSMLLNWHNFFFVSFDPAGFVSIDKPPLAFWLQVASARIFGLSPWSLLLPQALAGVLSVPLLAHLVRRTFGPFAGLLAATTLAVTPINVVTNRNLTMDSLLVFVLLLAAWAITHAAETGSLRKLLLSAVLVGIGFNIKMLDAYMVLPAFGLLYWFSAPCPPKTRLLHLALATAVLLLLSLCWLTIVDLTPATQRPYVGSSGSNSEIQLAFFYNGTSRVFGSTKELTLFPTAATKELQESLPAFALPSFWLGTPGLFRLITSPLGEQIGWLIPLAFLGLFTVQWDKPSFWPLNKQQQALALWGTWFLAQFAFFSGSSFTHQYYLVQMAPAICALLAIGVVLIWNELATRRRWFLPLALLGTALVQLLLLSSSPLPWEHWLTLLLLPGILAGIILSLPWRLPARGRNAIISIGFCVLLIAPILWSAIPVLEDRNETFPYAGPDVPMSQMETDVLQSDQQMLPDAQLISYLLKHQGHTPYLVATGSSIQAAPIILATNKAVMTLGGYAGGDQILSSAQLQRLIVAGSVRYFVFTQSLQQAPLSPALKAYQEHYQELLASSGIGSIEPLIQWVSTNCARVPQSAWHPASSAAGGTLLELFDCGQPATS